MNISTKFDIRDRVIIDGDQSVIAVIKGVSIDGYGFHQYLVCWFGSAGEFKEHFMYEWQLELAR